MGAPDESPPWVASSREEVGQTKLIAPHAHPAHTSALPRADVRGNLLLFTHLATATSHYAAAQVLPMRRVAPRADGSGVSSGGVQGCPVHSSI
jgi:hypothetical protein